MLLAAGLGTRMRPITNHTPKPLVQVAGRALIDWTLDPLAAAGVQQAVVNVHHLPNQMRAHLQGRSKPAIAISDESDLLLDTGGGIVNALPLLGDAPFYVCNCDGILISKPGQPSAFHKLAAVWDPSRLDVVMLLHPAATAHGFDGPGDFFMDSQSALRRRGTSATAPFVYAGVWIVHPRVFAGERAIPFSANRVWDKAIAEGRMIGVAHDGDWYHVGTPEAVPATTALLSRSRS